MQKASVFAFGYAEARKEQRHKGRRKIADS